MASLELYLKSDDGLDVRVAVLNNYSDEEIAADAEFDEFDNVLTWWKDQTGIDPMELDL